MHSALKNALASAKALLSNGRAAGEGRTSVQISGAERRAVPVFVALPCPKGNHFCSLGIRGGSRGRVALSAVPAVGTGRKCVQRKAGGSSTIHYSDAGSFFQYPTSTLTSLSFPLRSGGKPGGDRAETSRVADGKQ